MVFYVWWKALFCDLQCQSFELECLYLGNIVWYSSATTWKCVFPSPESRSAFGLFNFLVAENIGLLLTTGFEGWSGASNAVELAGDQLLDRFLAGVRDEFKFELGFESCCFVGFVKINGNTTVDCNLKNPRTLPDSFDAQQEFRASEQAFVFAQFPVANEWFLNNQLSLLD